MQFQPARLGEWAREIGWNAGYLIGAIVVAVAATAVDSITAPGGETCSMLCDRHSSSWYPWSLAGAGTLVLAAGLTGIIDCFTRQWPRGLLTLIVAGCELGLLAYLAFFRM